MTLSNTTNLDSSPIQIRSPKMHPLTREGGGERGGAYAMLEARPVRRFLIAAGRRIHGRVKMEVWEETTIGRYEGTHM
uniref:Uncharacterized protein n=1 Tax=Oryza sativa subsp. japonica TaxID=39947 RepID=Q6ZJN1_ORYSJ|nr:hypothetical protein [Oryza sativa Japonica Group]